MNASDKRAAAAEAGSSSAPLASLTRTLEDLEARLARLSGAKRSVDEGAAERNAAARAADDAAPDPSNGEKRRAGKTQRPSPLKRRFGTIAGELETLQMQGAALEAIGGVAQELKALRTEIQSHLAAGSASEGVEALFASFEDLRQMIAARENAGVLGTEVVQILDRLSELQNEGFVRGSIDTVRAELDTVGQLLAQMAKEDSVLAVSRRWDEFETRLADRVELDTEARRDLGTELARLRESVRSLATEDQVRAVERRWDEFEAHYLDTVRDQTEEQLTRVVRGELEALRTRLDTMEAGAAASTGEIGHRLSARMEEIEKALSDLPRLVGLQNFEERLREIGEAVERIAAVQEDPDLEHFVVLEERLDEISEAVVALAMRESRTLDMAPVERIEARIADLSARVDQSGANDDAARLSQEVAALSARIEALSAEPVAEVVDRRLQAFAERFETMLEEVRQPAFDAGALEARLSAIADRLDHSASVVAVDEGILHSLEAQIQDLSSRLADRPMAFATEFDPAIADRLTAIEERLDDMRDEMMVAARTAAEEAVRLMMEEGSERESQIAKALSDDLNSLDALCRRTDERSLAVMDSVHATLVKIAERLADIEHEMQIAPKSFEAPVQSQPVLQPMRAAAFPEPETEEHSAVALALEEEAPRGLRAAIARLGKRKAKVKAEEPSQDEENRPVSAVEPRPDLGDSPALDAADSIISREANRPLLPGSGAPDIASLLERVRRQQAAAQEASVVPQGKADFIAAARKAAMAAAAEAESLRENAAGNSEHAPDLDDDDGASSLARRRRPIMLGIGAVLLAMMALPFGRSLMAPSAESTGPSSLETALPNEEEVAEAGSSVMAPVSASTEPEAPEIAAAEPIPAVTDAAQPSPFYTASIEAAPAVNEPAEEVADQEEAEQAERAAAIALPARADPAEVTNASSPLISQAAMTPLPLPADKAPAEPALGGGDDEGIAAEAPVAPTAISSDSAAAPSSELMAEALSRLPANAMEELPDAPEGIGPEALVEASDAGDAKAMFEIGLRLMEGRAAEPDAGKALPWFAHSGALGFAPAQYSLGTLFEKGNGVERDTAAARAWYQLAAEQGNTRAMHNLGVLYTTGVDGKSDPQSAAQWFQRAAELGMRDSQYNLGILHARGAGVEQNFAESYRWFSIVGASGDRDAVAKRDEVATSLSPEEKGRIDAQVSLFKPLPVNAGANRVDVPDEWKADAEEPRAADMNRAIRNVQAILLTLGFDPGTPDGVVGDRTVEAVKAFQKQEGMAANGQIDEDLIRALLAKRQA